MERPHLETGTELRRHQIDALAGMLTELLSRHEEHPDGSNGGSLEGELDDDEDGDDLTDELEDEEAEFVEDPGAERRFRFRHPTASGKTIAAAGFVEAARTMGVLILTHRRLLVNQFTRDLTTEGYGSRLCDPVLQGMDPLRGNPHHPDLRLVRPARGVALADGLPARHLRRGAHRARREDERGDPQLPEPIYIGMTATEELIAKQVSDVFPLPSTICRSATLPGAG